MTDDLKAPERIGLIADGLGKFALAHREEADVAVHYVRADRIATLEVALADMTQQRDRQYDENVSLIAKQAATETERDAAMAGAVKVKPLVWVKHPSVDIWRADTAFGTYKVFGLGPTQSWDFDSFSDLNDKTSKSAESVTAAKAAAQADYEARILSALTPDPDRMLALTAAAYEDAAKEIDCGGCYGKCLAPGECHAEMALDIRALTPSDALAALSRIEAQAEARGVRKAAELVESPEWVVPWELSAKIEALADATEAAAKGGVW